MSSNAEASVFIHKSVAEAPQWSQMRRVESLQLAEFHVVRKGTEGGRSTVDIVLTDTDGMKYVAMTTGRVMRLLAEMIGDE